MVTVAGWHLKKGNRILFTGQWPGKWIFRETCNGEEKDEETGYNYYGARYYWSDGSIWLSVDPLADKYPHLSPYNYCALNPIIYVDPDGRDIKIAGSAEFRKATFNDMQKLSSSNLIMLKSGQVVEASGYKGPKSNIVLSGQGTGKKDFGTKMIHDLSSNKKHTVTVKQGDENNYLPTNSNYKDAQNPNVGSGGTLRYDPESTGSGIVNKDGTMGIGAYIQLGHELIHADNAMKGKMKNRNDDAKIDPDSVVFHPAPE